MERIDTAETIFCRYCGNGGQGLTGEFGILVVLELGINHRSAYAGYNDTETV